MRKPIAHWRAGCSLALLTTFASATTLAAAPPGPYLGAGVGVYTLDIDDIDFDDSAALIRGFGGLRLGAHWAVEADYQRLAESKDEVLGADVELDVEAWTLSLRPIFPIGEVVDIYGRAGWTWYDAEATASAAGIDASVDDSGNEFTWGGGVDFHLGDLLTLRGDFSRIEIEDTDLNIISASILLRF
jgi:opacity protein-like surface antigen